MVEKERLEKLVEAGNSTREIARVIGSNQSTVRRWLKGYGLVTRPSVRAVATACKLCGGPPRQYDGRARSLCGACNTRVRRYRTKAAAVKLMGGKCERCEWTGHLAGFDFHHKDGDKDFNIGSVANKSWDAIRLELEKCELLCRNCHSIEHAGERGELFMEIVNNYQGRLLGVEFEL